MRARGQHVQRLVSPGKRGEGDAAERAPLLLPPPPLTFGETKAGRPQGDSTPAMGSTGPGCRRPQTPSITGAWSGNTTGSCLQSGLSPGGVPHPFPLVKSLPAPEAPAAATGRPSESRSSGRWRHGGFAQGSWGPAGVPPSLSNPVQCVGTGTRGRGVCTFGSDLKGGRVEK